MVVMMVAVVMVMMVVMVCMPWAAATPGVPTDPNAQ